MSIYGPTIILIRDKPACTLALQVAVASSLNLRCFLRATFKDDNMVTLDLPDVHIHRQWSLASLQAELLPHLELSNGGSHEETVLKLLCQDLEPFVSRDF